MKCNDLFTKMNDFIIFLNHLSFYLSYFWLIGAISASNSAGKNRLCRIFQGRPSHGL